MMRLLLAVLAVAVTTFLLGCGERYAEDPQARKAAEWTLSRGGQVTVAEKPGIIRTPNALPRGEYSLISIDLNQLPDSKAPVRDQELDVLKGLTNIERLGLYASNVTDRCIPTLLELKSLKEIELSQTRITSKGVLQLAELPKLEKLFVRGLGPQMTAAVAKSFKEKRPNCELYY